jgi:DNA-binding HxlR family transcriptional regulator
MHNHTENITWPQARLTPSAARLLAALHELADADGFVLSLRSPDLADEAGGMSRTAFANGIGNLIERGLVTRRRAREFPARGYDYFLTPGE